MTISGIKVRTLKLMDEYSMRGTVRTDTDIQKKMNCFIDMAQKELAKIKPIEKTYTVPFDDDTSEYTMPSDFRAPKCTWVDGKCMPVGQWRAGKFICQNIGDVVVEYYAYPVDITDATDDSAELEIDRDAQELIPYWVAAQNFLTDVQIDYRSLLAIYDRMLMTLKRGSAKVVRL